MATRENKKEKGESFPMASPTNIVIVGILERSFNPVV